MPKRCPQWVNSLRLSALFRRHIIFPNRTGLPNGMCKYIILRAQTNLTRVKCHIHTRKARVEWKTCYPTIMGYHGQRSTAERRGQTRSHSVSEESLFILGQLSFWIGPVGRDKLWSSPRCQCLFLAAGDHWCVKSRH